MSQPHQDLRSVSVLGSPAAIARSQRNNRQSRSNNHQFQNGILDANMAYKDNNWVSRTSSRTAYPMLRYSRSTSPSSNPRHSHRKRAMLSRLSESNLHLPSSPSYIQVSPTGCPSKSKEASYLLSPLKLCCGQSKDEQNENNSHVGNESATMSEKAHARRGQWEGKYDFILNAVGYAVGLDNLWHFPYMCYRNGGGAFLIPYGLFLIFVGIPLFMMDISLGQFTSQGPLTCWEFAPILTGLGFGILVISVLVGIYYNVIIAYAIYYTFASFSKVLPWSGCNNAWNTPDCYLNLLKVNCTVGNLTAQFDGQCYNATSNKIIGVWDEEVFTNVTGRKPILPAQEYFHNEVVGLTKGIDDMGQLRWPITLCLLLGWIIVFLCSLKGMKKSTTIVHFTSLFPYFLMLVLFIRGVTLEGAFDGIYFYMVPDFSRLLQAEVWKDAGNQIFFSLSASWGGLVTLSSYNKFNSNVLRDTLVVSMCNCIMCFFCGFVIFSFLGHLAFVMNLPVNKVASKGLGMAFIVYPEAVNTLPGSPFWSVLFFLMLLIIGLDTQFTMIETVVTCISDKFPKRFRNFKKSYKLVLCIAFFLLGLPLTRSGGPYLMQLMDTYCEGWATLVIGLLKVLAVGWLYGRPGFSFHRPMLFVLDIETMIQKKLSPWWRITWQYTAPILLTGTILFSWIDYKPARYGTFYYYPLWAELMGWGMTLASLVWIPILMIYVVRKRQAPLPWYKRFWLLTYPSARWGPAIGKHRSLIVDYHRSLSNRNIPALSIEESGGSSWIPTSSKSNSRPHSRLTPRIESDI